jgi:beta-glucosidase/6-phospho-beta-glucosidase/beta-galactosidase
MNRYFKENNIKIHRSPEDDEILENTATLQRYKKKSFEWYKEVISTNGKSLI